MTAFKKPPKDRRLLATFAILGTELGILTLCIPLCPITGIDSLPIWSIVASAIAISSVWFFGKPTEVDKEQTKQIAELKATMLELKERVENVEVIDRFETKLAQEEPVEITRTMGPVRE
jgi:hypothetical protein